MGLDIDALQLQPRDIGLLRGLFESRIMTGRHIGILHFESKHAYAKKRLQKLKAAGLIGERKRNANEPAVLFLTRKGFSCLKSDGHLSGYPPLGVNSFEARADVSQFTLRHELEIMDVKSAIHAAVSKIDGFSVAEFSTWPLLYQFETTVNGYGSDVLVKPDGFIRIHEDEKDGGLSEHTFFLEVDRSSETQDTLVARAQAYLEYHRSGGFAVRNGATRDCFKEYPFRVLVVLKSAERRNNLAERLAYSTPPVLSQAWLSTFAEVTANPLGAIWMQPKEYRDVTKGTQFESTGQFDQYGYKRQTARDVFVESKVTKLPLLSS